MSFFQRNLEHTQDVWPHLPVCELHTVVATLNIDPLIVKLGQNELNIGLIPCHSFWKDVTDDLNIKACWHFSYCWYFVLSGFQNGRTADLHWEFTRVSEERAGVLFLQVRGTQVETIFNSTIWKVKLFKSQERVWSTWICLFVIQRKPLEGFVLNVPDGQRSVCPYLDNSQHGGHQSPHHWHGPHLRCLEM